MTVDSNATTGRPVAKASRTSALMVRNSILCVNRQVLSWRAWQLCVKIRSLAKAQRRKEKEELNATLEAH
jgi:hypothetical protein